MDALIILVTPGSKAAVELVLPTFLAQIELHYGRGDYGQLTVKAIVGAAYIAPRGNAELVEVLKRLILYTRVLKRRIDQEWKKDRRTGETSPETNKSPHMPSLRQHRDMVSAAVSALAYVAPFNDIDAIRVIGKRIYQVDYDSWSYEQASKWKVGIET